MICLYFTGTSAYIGSVQNITNKTFSTAAASILATNARFATWVASSVNGVEPWDGAFDVCTLPALEAIVFLR